MSSKVYAEMLEIALKRGKSSRGRRHISTYGGFHRAMSFAGPLYPFDGTISCYRDQTPVLTINFKDSLITDHGVHHQRDKRDATHWTWQLLALFKMGTEAYQFPFWTMSSAHENKFAQGVRWCRRINGTNWFHWPSYNVSLAQEYDASQAALSACQNWRYFEYCWHEGQWRQRFKDKEAERRWNAREKKRQK